MLGVCHTLEKVASSNATVVLIGENGTGKGLLTRGLHEASLRKEGKFVAVDCSTATDTLESELFGYEKGAFVGATKLTLGKIEAASGGTLMLDEIGDLQPSLQTKLLHLLRERTVERLGTKTDIAVDVRIVCATRKDLKGLVTQGHFREDLYYRLAEIVVSIPPLRDRDGDPAWLAHMFLRRFAQEQNRGPMSLDWRAVRAIEAYPWPGNVPELRNCIKRGTIMANSNQLSPDDIGLEAALVDEANDTLDLRQIREEAERRAIVVALGRVNGNVVKAAELLRVSRPTLYDLMRRLGLK